MIAAKGIKPYKKYLIEKPNVSLNPVLFRTIYTADNKKIYPKNKIMLLTS